jgi:undecaprenyl-diphosphatase
MTSVMLIVTGFILLITRFVPKRAKNVSFATALVIGVGQALAILPGISRSGSTIATGMIVGVEPSEAAEFSFLLAIPAILGAVVLKINELLTLDTSLMGQYAVGTLAAFGLGLVAVFLLLKVIRRGKFDYFAYYCFAAGALGLYIFL